MFLQLIFDVFSELNNLFHLNELFSFFISSLVSIVFVLIVSIRLYSLVSFLCLFLCLFLLELLELLIDILVKKKVVYDFRQADIQNYAEMLSKLSIKNQDSIDKEIVSRSQNWDSTRITLMDKLILRLILAEIIFIDHVPPKVSIAEGIEIAKAMSTDDSSAFVNGILDSFFNDELNIN